MHHPSQHARYGNVQDCADRQGSDHANGQVALRILGLLRRGRHRVETNVGEEDVGSSRPNSSETVRRIGMPVRTPVGGIDVACAQSDHEQYDRHLDGHDGRVETRALFDADDQNRRDHQRDDEGRQIKSNFRPKQMRRA